MAESVQTQLERAHEILDLLSAEDWVTSTTISQHVGQSSKSAKFYIDRLRGMGHEIEGAPGKGFRLEARVGDERLLLSDDEMITLFMSLERADRDFPRPVLNRIKRRLIHLLSKNRQRQVKALEQPQDENTRSFFQNLEAVKIISKAREAERLIRISYQGLKDEEARLRVVQPLGIKETTKGWYLEAWEVKGACERSFRLDRLSDVIPLSEKNVIDPGAVKFAHHPWDFGQDPIGVQIKVRPDLARWLEENPEHPSQSLQPLECGNVAVSYEVRCPGKFLDWLLGLRGFELLGPDSLKQRLRERAETLFHTLGTLNVPWEVSKG